MLEYVKKSHNAPPPTHTFSISYLDVYDQLNVAV